MNAMQQRYPHTDLPPPHRTPPDEVRLAVANASAILEQPPPPSVREILTAYRTKGDGDRDTLLAMLNAKTAEDQRIASLASLQRTVIELYQQTNSPEFLTPPRSAATNYQSYPPPYPPPNNYPPERSSRRSSNAHRHASRSRSPPRSHSHMQPPPRDIVNNTHPDQHPRKRHRASRSPPPHQSAPHRTVYESPHPNEQFPPRSPYSSSDRSESSAEYHPRARAPMNIGSLLPAGPRREPNGEVPPQERE